jgi:predicted MFS family arabinose efflux permease
MNSVEILVPLGFFGMIVAIVYIQARKRVQLTLIQHKADAAILKTDKDANGALKFGLLMVGIAVGILLGNFLSNYGIGDEVAYFSMVLIFGGISLLVYYFLMKNEANKNLVKNDDYGRGANDLE